MKNKIKTIEDLSLNAWPSHQIQIYDGWILRFSYFYTHRTNCIEQIGPLLFLWQISWIIAKKFTKNGEVLPFTK